MWYKHVIMKGYEAFPLSLAAEAAELRHHLLHLLAAPYAYAQQQS